MLKLTCNDLYGLEKYAAIRDDFRARVMLHKQQRRVAIGEHAALYFEDALTIQYQIQEMLRIEHIVDVQGIEDELAVYNPLIPSGTNWQATFMLEFAEAGERRQMLTWFVGIEQHVYVQVYGQPRVYAIYDEDMERSTAVKTSAVHFMRFELTSAMIAAVGNDTAVLVGISHPQYQIECAMPDAARLSLRQDLVIT